MSWDIKISNGEVVASAGMIGMYSETTNVCLPGGKYNFKISDASRTGFIVDMLLDGIQNM